MNISSVVVQCKPESMDEVKRGLLKDDLCEIHLEDDKGRIIITLEGSGIEEEIAKLKKVQSIKGVISAEMMYSYAENELDQIREKLEFSEAPEWLNDDNIRAEDIRYKGDLKKKL
ncbi:MAG: nitrate reductase [Bacteroidetes bacterium]|nr:nitrate reductase [Bacteroidota bacterium]|tara:strand:- start:177 stop:521 length:345 start_codon:yes stop_codon:yes gene_type:complete